MPIIHLEISNLRSIKNANIEIPFDSGIYTFVGANGCGKSTLMQCLALLNRKYTSDFWGVNRDSNVKFSINNRQREWTYKANNCLGCSVTKPCYYGMYEGSLFYGTRFEDSRTIDAKISSSELLDNDITDADDYVKDNVSFILHGDYTHYRTLKRIRNRDISLNLGFSNLPYFIEIDGKLLSQYRMSSGECLLISLMHFFNNAIERGNLNKNTHGVIIIDELELALHPLAILRLMDYLNNLIKDHTNITIYLSSHSPEVIKTIPPRNLYKVDLDTNGRMTLTPNCYPSYLIRDLYSNISPDYLILVEDHLANLVVERVLSQYKLRSGKLIHCVPAGGWSNIFDLRNELYSKKILGTNTKIVCIFDGDVPQKATAEQRKKISKIAHGFLPVKSVETFVYETLKIGNDKRLKQIIKDKYFTVDSLDNIITEYNDQVRSGMRDYDKNFYSFIVKRLENIGTSESVFVSGICDDLLDNSPNIIEKFKDTLLKLLF